MADPDYGKASRENYKLKHPDEEQSHPEIDKAYEDGPTEPDPQGLTKKQVADLRKKLAELATRYGRASSGYVGGESRKGPKQANPPLKDPDLDPAREEQINGGTYLKPDAARDLTDKQRCDNA